MLDRLKHFWRDPVWSQIIATAFIAFASVTLGFFRIQIADLLRRSTIARFAIVAGFPSVLIVFGCWYYAFHTRLLAELDVVLDDFPHAPFVDLSIRNLSWKSVQISTIEFLTKRHWNMPDPLRHGFSVPVVTCLPKNTPFIKISPEIGSVSSRAVGIVVGARKNILTRFRLTTDHAPSYPFGIFPFHLGVEIVYGKQNLRMQLPNILVSLHGKSALGEVVMSESTLGEGQVGDCRNDANQALSTIQQGARSTQEIIKVLKNAAGM